MAFAQSLYTWQQLAQEGLLQRNSHYLQLVFLLLNGLPERIEFLCRPFQI